jgi:hypothetical protein
LCVVFIEFVGVDVELNVVLQILNQDGHVVREYQLKTEKRRMRRRRRRGTSKRYLFAVSADDHAWQSHTCTDLVNNFIFKEIGILHDPSSKDNGSIPDSTTNSCCRDVELTQVNFIVITTGRRAWGE